MSSSRWLTQPWFCVCHHFGFRRPQLITTVTPQIVKDAEIQAQQKVDAGMSLYVTAARRTLNDTLCVTDDEERRAYRPDCR